MISLLLILILTLLDRSYSGAALLSLAVYSILSWKDLGIKPIRLMLPMVCAYLVGACIGVAEVSIHYYRDISFAVVS